MRVIVTALVGGLMSMLIYSAIQPNEPEPAIPPWGVEYDVCAEVRCAITSAGFAMRVCGNEFIDTEGHARIGWHNEQGRKVTLPHGLCLYVYEERDDAKQ